MPGGSSVRSLLPSSLKATRNRNNQPSLSVGRTELTALLYFICFQESFKRKRRVLELCSWPMREAVVPLHCWSEPGLNHGLLPSARVYARKDSGKKQEHDQTIPPKYIHMCTRLSNKANDRAAESSHIGKARENKNEVHLSPKLVPIPPFYPPVGDRLTERSAQLARRKTPQAVFEESCRYPCG